MQTTYLKPGFMFFSPVLVLVTVLFVVAIRFGGMAPEANAADTYSKTSKAAKDQVDHSAPGHTCDKCNHGPAYPEIVLSQEHALQVGKRIWINECAGTIEGLMTWNKGEEFASLGIGHFIWYPTNYEGPFQESFPKLINYLRQQEVKLPEGLTPDSDCPWSTREEFYAAKDTKLFRDIRTMLVENIHHQANFIALRLQGALPKMVQGIPEAQEKHIVEQFLRMAQIPHGIYCLVDYVNFKGEGIKETERYAGNGWGLLQVLTEMSGKEGGDVALNNFADKATYVLQRRVKNSPSERNETRWMKGWTNRCNTYRPPQAP